MTSIGLGSALRKSWSSEDDDDEFELEPFEFLPDPGDMSNRPVVLYVIFLIENPQLSIYYLSITGCQRNRVDNSSRDSCFGFLGGRCKTDCEHFTRTSSKT
jgi:hypothetical protein